MYKDNKPCGCDIMEMGRTHYNNKKVAIPNIAQPEYKGNIVNNMFAKRP